MFDLNSEGCSSPEVVPAVSLGENDIDDERYNAQNRVLKSLSKVIQGRITYFPMLNYKEHLQSKRAG